MTDETPSLRKKIVSIIIFIASLAFSVAVFFLPIQPEKLAVFGYAGMFLITLLGAMTLFIPGPTMVAAFMIGSELNPFIVSLVAGFGSALGETTGYTAGYATRAIVQDPSERRVWYWRILRWMKRYPFVTLFVLSAVPNFVTDVSGLIAGRIQYPYLKFLFATFLGKTVRFGVTAFLGARFGHKLF